MNRAATKSHRRRCNRLRRLIQLKLAERAYLDTLKCEKEKAKMLRLRTEMVALRGSLIHARAEVRRLSRLPSVHKPPPKMR